jgi:hypothetical protein
MRRFMCILLVYYVVEGASPPPLDTTRIPGMLETGPGRDTLILLVAPAWVASAKASVPQLAAPF